MNETDYMENIRKVFIEQSMEYERFELIARQRGLFDDAFLFQEYAKQSQYGSPADMIRGYNW